MSEEDEKNEDYRIILIYPASYPQCNDETKGKWHSEVAMAMNQQTEHSLEFTKDSGSQPVQQVNSGENEQDSKQPGTQHRGESNEETNPRSSQETTQDNLPKITHDQIVSHHDSIVCLYPTDMSGCGGVFQDPSLMKNKKLCPKCSHPTYLLCGCGTLVLMHNSQLHRHVCSIQKGIKSDEVISHYKEYINETFRKYLAKKESYEKGNASRKPILRFSKKLQFVVLPRTEGNDCKC